MKACSLRQILVAGFLLPCFAFAASPTGIDRRVDQLPKEVQLQVTSEIISLANTKYHDFNGQTSALKQCSLRIGMLNADWSLKPGTYQLVIDDQYYSDRDRDQAWEEKESPAVSSIEFHFKGQEYKYRLVCSPILQQVPSRQGVVGRLLDGPNSGPAPGFEKLSELNKLLEQDGLQIVVPSDRAAFDANADKTDGFTGEIQPEESASAQ